MPRMPVCGILGGNVAESLWNRSIMVGLVHPLGENGYFKERVGDESFSSFHPSL